MACKVCKEDIKPDAAICIHCDSLQNDWIRSLSRTKEILLAIIAIAPLYYGAVALWQLVPEEKVAKIRTMAVQCHLDRIKLAIANSGALAAVVTDVHVRVVENDVPDSADIFLAPVGNPADLFSAVVKPDDPLIADLAPTLVGQKAWFRKVSSGSRCSYRITVAYRDLNGKSDAAEDTCGCATS